ncbi:hypothetical protein H2248_004124 [Termitomyces sp. 'cryptogamus']|nr:hypothetical protein H2248_004124 [Termitomyces sp. 'cryptogamus']
MRKLDLKLREIHTISYVLGGPPGHYGYRCHANIVHETRISERVIRLLEIYTSPYVLEDSPGAAGIGVSRTWDTRDPHS